MEWVETVAKTLAEAREMALDRLGVGEDDAEFEVLEEPKPGLFGRLRGEARVRARVRPAAVRPKQDRRRGKRAAPTETSGTTVTTTETTAAAPSSDEPPTERKPAGRRRAAGNGDRAAASADAGAATPASNPPA